MKTSGLLLLGFLLCAPTSAEERNTSKQDVTRWYEALNTTDSGLIERLVSEHWVDMPAAPDQPTGRAGAKYVLVELTTAFPDLREAIRLATALAADALIMDEPAGRAAAQRQGIRVIGTLRVLWMLRKQDYAIWRKPMSVCSTPPFEPIQISTKLSLICTAKEESDVSLPVNKHVLIFGLTG